MGLTAKYATFQLPYTSSGETLSWKNGSARKTCLKVEGKGIIRMINPFSQDNSDRKFNDYGYFDLFVDGELYIKYNINSSEPDFKYTNDVMYKEMVDNRLLIEPKLMAMSYQGINGYNGIMIGECANIMCSNLNIPFLKSFEIKACDGGSKAPLFAQKLYMSIEYLLQKEV